jgi:hypothetical protein
MPESHSRALIIGAMHPVHEEIWSESKVFCVLRNNPATLEYIYV